MVRRGSSVRIRLRASSPRRVRPTTTGRNPCSSSVRIRLRPWPAASMRHNGAVPNGRIQVGIGGSIRRRALLVGGSVLLLATAIAAGATSGSVSSARAAGTLHAVKLGSFQNPVYPAQAPGEPKLLFVVEQGGRVMVIDDGKTLNQPFLNIRDRVLGSGDPGAGPEQGLLSIAFPPDYPQSRRFYVYFTNNKGNIEIDEFRRSAVPTVANPATRRPVIVVPHPTYSNHNGGTMQFG